MITVQSKFAPYFFAFLFSFLFISAIQAQDSLFLRNGEHIIGSVKEIDNKSVKYKKNANPDGPSYVIERCSVRQIVYQNGHKDEFASCNPTQKQQVNNRNNIWLTADDLTTPAPITQSTWGGELWDSYAYNGIVVPRRTIRDIMKRDNPQASALFEKASKQTYRMLGLSILAGSLVGTGIILVDMDTSDDRSNINKRDNIPLSLGFCLAGVATFIPALNLVLKSHQNEQRAILLYNNGLNDGTTRNRLLGQKNQQPKLMIGGMSNGVGIGVRF